MDKKLIVVADLGALRAYRVTKDVLEQSPRIDLVHSVEPSAAHERIQDQVTDKAGRFPSANGGMSAGENHNLTAETTKRLIRRLADEINGVVQRERVHHWDFAAGRAINQRIVDELLPDVRSRIRKNLGADLVKLGKAELLAQF